MKIGMCACGGIYCQWCGMGDIFQTRHLYNFTPTPEVPEDPEERARVFRERLAELLKAAGKCP
jgi:hypothetical protein